MDYLNKLVVKPWGHETEIYRNDNISVWHLSINKFHSTSLHCHPNKKTVLVVLSGGMEFSFLNEKKNLLCGNKVTIRHGVFHSSKAMTENVQLLEIETPPNKEDLVRLQDNYGREFTPYESGDSIKKNNNIIVNDFPQQLGDLNVRLYNSSNLNNLTEDDILIIKDGNINKNGFIIAGPGDPCTIQSIKKFEENGFHNLNLSFLVISK